MFNKILIANRGEIACRVAKTAQRMGIRTVAIYSEADRSALHVDLCDEAWLVGDAAVEKSYLRGERIIDIALRSGAEAIHPGYGFLSENPSFAIDCATAGIKFIGPPPSAIEAMGLKAESKRLMESARVPLVPGYHGTLQDASHLAKEVSRIGYPVLIKASAGGGGKGMRIVHEAKDFAEALMSCQREAQSSFGDPSVLLEKYLQGGRHIEIQVFADSHKNCVYLFERDCSVQRRHQKVLEEAPAPHISLETRKAMGEAATAAALAVGYEGAGTVEFIMDRPERGGAFYFMEMNTRLQVEHPVTEMITGLDLVEWQLRVADGEALPLRQEDLRIQGHAMEVRIYAENPALHFLPSIGHLGYVQFPKTNASVRIDTGIRAGDDISPYYDPMIAKLIVWGKDREEARLALQGALQACYIAPLMTNLAFLNRLVKCPPFVAGRHNTSLIETEQVFLLPVEDNILDPVVALAVLHELTSSGSVRESSLDWQSPWMARDGWRLNTPATRSLRYRFGQKNIEVEVEWLTPPGVEQASHPPTGTFYGRLKWAKVEGILSGYSILSEGGYELHIIWQERHSKAMVVLSSNEGKTPTESLSALHVLFYEERRYDYYPVPLGKGASSLAEVAGSLLAPMSGKVLGIMAEAGASLNKGAPILVMEAMKMEHSLRAPADGILQAILCRVGDQVNEGQVLASMSDPSPAKNV